MAPADERTTARICQPLTLLWTLQLTMDQVTSLQKNPKIKSVQIDNPVYLQQQSPSPAASPQPSPLLHVQQAAPWHLDRISQPNLPLSGTYSYTLDGSDINVYILDTVGKTCFFSCNCTYSQAPIACVFEL